MKYTKSLAVAGAALFAASMAAAPAQAAPERMRQPERRAGLMERRADINLVRVAISASTVIINGDSGCFNRVRFTATVHAPLGDPERLRSVTARMIAPGGVVVDVPSLTRLRIGSNVLYTGFIELCGSDPVGRYRLVTTVLKSDEDNILRRETDERFIAVKRPTSLSYDATPEPVTQGDTLTHTGRLMFDPEGPGGFVGAGGERLVILFQRRGSDNWQIRRFVTTNPNGRFTATTTATQDGTWRVSYPENRFHQTQNALDFVNTVPAP